MEDIAAIFRRNVGLWEKRDLDRIKEAVDASYRGHTTSGSRDREGLMRRIEEYHARYSDLRIRVLDQIVSGDRVASRLEATAIENARGEPVRLFGMNMSVFRNGKLVEEWAVWEVV
jgi:SnoaL-like polyketide cyclase